MYPVTIQMPATVIHVVICLAPGGLERLVVDMTCERNRRMPGSTRICCLDSAGEQRAESREHGEESGTGSEECKVQGEKCKEDEELLATDVAGRHARQDLGKDIRQELTCESTNQRIDKLTNRRINKSTDSGVVFCVNAHRSRFPWDFEAVKRLRAVCREQRAESREHGTPRTAGVSATLREDGDQRTEFAQEERKGWGEEENKYRSTQIPKYQKRQTEGMGGARGTTEAGGDGLGSQPYAPCTKRHAFVLHAHNMAAWQYAVLAAWGTGARVMYTQHGANPHTTGWFNKLRAWWLLRHTERVVAVSNATADTMSETLGIPRDRIEVVPNGIRWRAEGGGMRPESGAQSAESIAHRGQWIENEKRDEGARLRQGASVYASRLRRDKTARSPLRCERTEDGEQRSEIGVSS